MSRVPLARCLDDWFQRETPAMLRAVEEIVALESPSGERVALAACADWLMARFQAMRATVERIPTEAGDILLVDAFQTEARDPTRKPVLLLGHYDTVWSVGTLARLPFRRDGERVLGPGVYDMKANLVVAEFCLRALAALAEPPARPVRMLITPDEEVGSQASRHWIEKTALGCAHVLVLEPPLASGALKTSRKGVGRFELEARGRAAHAGVEPEKGVNAIVELAHQILAIQELADPGAGTTLNVGVISGGTTTNVVPASASARIDARVSTTREAERVFRALSSLRPVLAEASLVVSGGFNRPPMERTPAIAALYERAREVAAALGIALAEGTTGGGSDGNFTAAVGVPTLDGLGLRGGGAHADDEHILASDLAPRATFLAALLRSL